MTQVVAAVIVAGNLLTSAVIGRRLLKAWRRERREGYE